MRINCCLCGKEIDERESNNPWPLTDNDEDRCCGDCNLRKVIPARIQMMYNNKEDSLEND